jgi:hypothetical protein
MIVAVGVTLLTNDGKFEETVDDRVAVMLAVAVGAGATCPHPAKQT